MAVAYDVVLEDHILAHQAEKRRQRPFAREIAEMVRYAVGYQSRAFVTFGAPITLDGVDPESRREIMDLAHVIRETIGRLHKVLPTAVLAAALKPSITRRELEARAEAIIDTVRSAGGNMGVTQDAGARRRSRAARSSQHHSRRARRTISRTGANGSALLRARSSAPADGFEAGTANTLMIGYVSRAFFHTLAGSRTLQATRIPLRDAQPEQLRAAVHRRRND